MKWFLILIFVAANTVVHFRGKVRLNYWRQLINHSALLAPINVFLYAFSKVPATPYFPASTFPEMQKITDNWEIIREEALRLLDHQHIKAAQQNNDAGFNSFFKKGWKRFYLKWYGASHPSAEALCPTTVALLRSIPSIKAAMFTELPPGGVLNPHRDPWGGSIRYHLGLVTPNDDRCYIEVDGERYSWRDGECVFFDETFIHEAHNHADSTRLILFCDVDRPMRYRWARAVNHFLGNTLVTMGSSPNREGDQTGIVNRLFHYAWVMGQYRRRLKKWNRTVYQIIRVILIIAVLGFIIYI